MGSIIISPRCNICPKISYKISYIYSDEYLINKWKLLFSKYEEKIVAYIQGNPETEQGIHKGRSFLLNEFSTV